MAQTNSEFVQHYSVYLSRQPLTKEILEEIIAVNATESDMLTIFKKVDANIIYSYLDEAIYTQIIVKKHFSLIVYLINDIDNLERIETITLTTFRIQKLYQIKPFSSAVLTAAIKKINSAITAEQDIVDATINIFDYLHKNNKFKDAVFDHLLKNIDLHIGCILKTFELFPVVTDTTVSSFFKKYPCSYFLAVLKIVIGQITKTSIDVFFKELQDKQKHDTDGLSLDDIFEMLKIIKLNNIMTDMELQAASLFVINVPIEDLAYSFSLSSATKLVNFFDNMASINLSSQLLLQLAYCQLSAYANSSMYGSNLIRPFANVFREQNQIQSVDCDTLLATNNININNTTNDTTEYRFRQEDSDTDDNASDDTSAYRFRQEELDTDNASDDSSEYRFRQENLDTDDNAANVQTSLEENLDRRQTELRAYERDAENERQQRQFVDVELNPSSILRIFEKGLFTNYPQTEIVDVIYKLPRREVFTLFLSTNKIIPEIIIDAMLTHAKSEDRLEIFSRLTISTPKQQAIVEKYTHLPTDYILNYKLYKAKIFLDNEYLDLPYAPRGTIIRDNVIAKAMDLESLMEIDVFDDRNVGPNDILFIFSLAHTYCISADDLYRIFTDTDSWLYPCFGYGIDGFPTITDNKELPNWRSYDANLHPPIVKVILAHVSVKQLYSVCIGNITSRIILVGPAIKAEHDYVVSGIQATNRADWVGNQHCAASEKEYGMYSLDSHNFAPETAEKLKRFFQPFPKEFQLPERYAKSNLACTIV